jgi:hypothetical protein
MSFVLRFPLVVLLFGVLAVSASAQQPAQNAGSMSLADYARQAQGYKPPEAGAAPASQPPGPSVADRARDMQAKDLARVKVSPEDAQKILNSVDTVLKFASNDSGLAIHSSVKRRMISRDEMVKGMKDRQVDDEEARRLQAEELTLKKFGYVPRVFSTGKFVDSMYEEEVAGFYDPRTKVISLLNWVPPEGQLDVLAHELTHALQDQNFNLTTWQKSGESSRHPQAFQVSASEATGESSGRQAIVEGQAMVVLIDHQFEQHGMDLKLENMRGASEALSQYMAMVVPDTPTIHAAPVFLREAMAFPYREGLVFEMELLAKGGKELAFNRVFAHPPLNTHEILHPEAYESAQKVHAPRIPDVSDVVSGKYEIADAGGMGELDVRSLVKQLGNTRLADNIARGWRGGSYLALKRKGVNTANATTADIALMYVSAWDSSDTALRFARFYADAVPRRYRQVSAIDTPCNGTNCPLHRFQFETEEGIVNIECQPNNLVIVTESFEPGLAPVLNTAMLKANSGTGRNKAMALATPDLSLRYASSPVFAGLNESMRQQAIKEVMEMASH